jgi:hypothetical protein
MRIALLIVALMILAVPLIAVNADAQPQVVESSTDTLGMNEVTWTSGFADLNYVEGAPVTITVTWSGTGLVEFDGVALRGYNPKSKGAVQGTDPVAVYPGSAGANSVDITVQFLALHFDGKTDAEIGVGHFTVYLRVDEDGDGVTDSSAGFGVNLYVSDPL